MTLQELRFLVALADTGHFGKAADRCHVTQPTLSTGLKKLEDYLGVVIFDRTLRRVVPTPVGRGIVECARRVVVETQRMKELAQSMKDPMQRVLRLGVIPTLGPYYLPHMLKHVHAAHPKLQLALVEETTARVLRDLTEGQLDAALLALPLGPEDAGFDSMSLFLEPFLVAMPQDHPLAQLKVVPTNKLVRCGLMLLEDGHCLRGQALEACGLVDLPHEDVRATSLETLRQMVGMGLGVTLMPILATMQPAPTVQTLALRPMQSKKAKRRIGLVWRKRAPVSQTVQTLGQTLRHHLPAGVEPATPLRGERGERDEHGAAEEQIEAQPEVEIEEHYPNSH